MVLSIIAQDKTLITYRPKLNELTGSITATILLQQIMYWWDISGNKEFYKFKAPCNHPDYKEGDSWTESLGMTIDVFDSAYKKLKELGIVFTRNTIDRKTYYSIDENRLEAYISQIYLNGKIPDRKTGKTDLLNGKIPDRYKTETTTETTKNKKIYKKEKNENEKEQSQVSGENTHREFARSRLYDIPAFERLVNVVVGVDENTYQPDNQSKFFKHILPELETLLDSGEFSDDEFNEYLLYIIEVQSIKTSYFVGYKFNKKAYNDYWLNAFKLILSNRKTKLQEDLDRAEEWRREKELENQIKLENQSKSKEQLEKEKQEKLAGVELLRKALRRKTTNVNNQNITNDLDSEKLRIQKQEEELEKERLRMIKEKERLEREERDRPRQEAYQKEIQEAYQNSSLADFPEIAKEILFKYFPERILDIESHKTDTHRPVFTIVDINTHKEPEPPLKQAKNNLDLSKYKQFVN